MKALVTAFALLSFVAASTIPVVAHAQTKTEQTMQHSKKKHKKVAKKAHVKKKTHAKKKVTKSDQKA